MMKASAPVKVGILAILSTLILIFGIMWLKGRSISIGEKIEVNFKDIDGMRPGSAVQMMGLRIGQVDEIIPVIDGENSYITVRFVINTQNVQIPLASRISVQQSGIIGEKFLEVTPPFTKTALFTINEDTVPVVNQDTKVELFSNGEYREIGRVKSAEIVELGVKRNYKINYVLTIPGIDIPASSVETLVKSGNKDKYVLRIYPPHGIVVKIPENPAKYTVVEPIRMKDFLDVQLKAALALKETNDKINNLFTDQFMDDVRYTFENTKDLSEKAAIIVDQVAIIIESSKEDIEQLIASSVLLSENMSELSKNVNEIVKDSEFKETIITTTSTIRDTSQEFSNLLRNSRLEDSFVNLNSTTKDMSEIASYVNELTKDEEFTGTVEETVTNLNDLMIKLGRVTESLEELTVEEKEKIREIINNSNKASKDLQKFSEKLNKRSLLLRFLI